MNNLPLLLPIAGDTDSAFWATVTQASPLRVKLDGDDSALIFAPDCLVRGLRVDDRVRVTVTGRRVTVLGVSGKGLISAGTYAAATDDVLAARVGSDTVDRLVVNADGKLEWGPGGSTALDTNLYRSGVSALKTDDGLEVALNLLVDGAADFAGGKLLKAVYAATVSSNLALVTTKTEATGSAVNVVSTKANATYAAVLVVDVQSLGTTATTGTAELYINDAVTDGSQALFHNGAVNNVRGTVTQVVPGTLATAGTYSFSIYGARVGGADSMLRINATHSRLLVFLFE